MKNEYKIRKLLGNKYHLGVGISMDFNEKEICQWKLFKYYDDSRIYLSKDNMPIMDSEHNTEKQLLEYAKKHHEIDWFSSLNRIRMIILIILLLVSVINIYFGNKFVRLFILTSELYLMSSLLVQYIIYDHNHKVKMRDLREN